MRDLLISFSSEVVAPPFFRLVELHGGTETFAGAAAYGENAFTSSQDAGSPNRR